jgi:hypothetical protein
MTPRLLFARQSTPASGVNPRFERRIEGRSDRVRIVAFSARPYAAGPRARIPLIGNWFFGSSGAFGWASTFANRRINSFKLFYPLDEIESAAAVIIYFGHAVPHIGATSGP